MRTITQHTLYNKHGANIFIYNRKFNWCDIVHFVCDYINNWQSYPHEYFVLNETNSYNLASTLGTSLSLHGGSRSTHPFIFLRSIKWVSGTPGDWVVKSKLSPRSDSVALRQLNPIYKKRPIKCFFSNFITINDYGNLSNR